MTELKKPAYMSRIAYHATLLGAFTALSTILLVMGNKGTAEEIKKQLLEDTRKSISQVIPRAIHDNNILDDKIQIKHQDRDITVYRARLKQKITAVAYQVRGLGYGGEILIIIGVKIDGSILGVRVLKHSETPGLGDKIEEKKDPWIYGFDGLSLQNNPDNEWAVKKDSGRFDQFSGATITPRAVVNAVKGGLDFFKAYRLQLVDQDSKTDHKEDSENEQ